ncbi:hypothetical protein ACI3LC_001878, partial [Salmonella enterica subsp. enterica serovar Kentucky]
VWNKYNCLPCFYVSVISGSDGPIFLPTLPALNAKDTAVGVVRGSLFFRNKKPLLLCELPAYCEADQGKVCSACMINRMSTKIITPWIV